jgi:hypothetical protein
MWWPNTPSRAPELQLSSLGFLGRGSVGKVCGFRVVAKIEIDRNIAAPRRGERVERPCRRLEELNQVHARKFRSRPSLPRCFRSFQSEHSIAKRLYTIVWGTPLGTVRITPGKSHDRKLTHYEIYREIPKRTGAALANRVSPSATFDVADSKARLAHLPARKSP